MLPAPPGIRHHAWRLISTDKGPARAAPQGARGAIRGGALRCASARAVVLMYAGRTDAGDRALGEQFQIMLSLCLLSLSLSLSLSLIPPPLLLPLNTYREIHTREREGGGERERECVCIRQKPLALQ